MSFAKPIRLPWLLLISAAVYAADQISKIWVSHLIPVGGAIPVLPRILRITHWTNEGAAFSIFADAGSPFAVRWGLVSFASLMAVGVLALMIYWGSRMRIATVALALIFGGALGNVHDRVAFGSVIDFIEVHIFSYHWPDFNIADSAIVTGACLLILDSLLPDRTHTTRDAEPETSK